MLAHLLLRFCPLAALALSALLAACLAPRLARAQAATDTSANSDDAISDDAISDDAISDDAISDDAISDDAISDDAISDEAMPEPVDEAPVSDVEAANHDDFRDRLLVVGLRAGLGVPSIFNDLGLSYDLSLELGVILPVLDGRLALSADVSYSAPAVSGSGTDPRVGASGGDWTYDVTNQRLVVSLGPVFRVFPPGSFFVPYVGVFGRMYMLRSTANGTGGGQPFGENTETSTAYGVAGAVGGELRLGPGVALLEVSVGWAKLDQKITGSTSAGELAAQLGYRLFL